jgi:predicted transcriptional regulator of viral defense system
MHRFTVIYMRGDKMFYTYDEVIKQYKNDYQLKKAILRNEILKVKPGLYSDKELSMDTPEVFIKRQDAVLTLQSAFHYHGVTDYVPDFTYIATPRNAYPIKDSEIKQIFMSGKYHSIGIEEYNQDGNIIRVYNLERTLIELIRYESKISFEEYHHVLRKFRDKKDNLNFNKLMTYAKQFKSYKKIVGVIQNSII